MVRVGVDTRYGVEVDPLRDCASPKGREYDARNPTIVRIRNTRREVGWELTRVNKLFLAL